jgi:hypothetical protein
VSIGTISRRPLTLSAVAPLPEGFRGGAPVQQAEVRCDRCKYMFPPLALGGCRLVRGPIRGSATCDQFTPRR